MSKELGIGVRVWVGWYPSEFVEEVDPRVQTGRIDEGPFLPGLYYLTDGRVALPQETIWNVAMDSGERISSPERLLFPIDDDTEQAEEHKTREVEV